MPEVLMADVYRFGKSKLFYGMAIFTGLLAFFLVMVIRQDVRFGISVFGDVIAFKEIADVIRIGAAYQKGLGIVAAVMISIFIGQEYQWKTWQQKWLVTQSRSSIYLSKVMLSSAVSVVLFLLFQSVVLLSSGQIMELLTVEYAVLMTGSMFIYAALGSVICLLSMLIKNSTASTVVCLGYILMSETFVSVIKNITGLSGMAASLVEWGIRHSIYGMSILVTGTAVPTDFIVPVVINSLVIISLSTAIGLFVFNEYEL